MPKYWVITPYDSTQKSIFTTAWEFDLKNETIAVGWSELGDTSNLDRDQLGKRYGQVYDEPTKKGLNRILNFLYEVKEGDVLIARQGRKKILSIGTVQGTPFYDLEKGRERVGGSDAYYYPNFLPVHWDGEEKYFGNMVFSFTTLYEIPKSRFEELVEEKPQDIELSPLVEETQEFLLEKYLEEFIISNFGAIFGGHLQIHSDADGRTGRQYPTEIGVIDILAIEPQQNTFVVIELKRGRSSDVVIGQILRYMGWIQENRVELGRPTAEVRGLIVCKDKDPRLEYALKMVPAISTKFYKINFQLFD